MGNWFWYVWAVIVIPPLAFIAVQVIRHRGFKGAIFGGRIEKTFGELDCEISFGIRSRIRVHRISSPTGATIGLEVAKSGFFGYDMTPFKMTRDETKDLIALLEKAIDEHDRSSSDYAEDRT